MPRADQAIWKSLAEAPKHSRGPYLHTVLAEEDLSLNGVATRRTRVGEGRCPLQRAANCIGRAWGEPQQPSNSARRSGTPAASGRREKRGSLRGASAALGSRPDPALGGAPDPHNHHPLPHNRTTRHLRETKGAERAHHKAVPGPASQSQSPTALHRPRRRHTYPRPLLSAPPHWLPAAAASGEARCGDSRGGSAEAEVPRRRGLLGHALPVPLGRGGGTCTDTGFLRGQSSAADSVKPTKSLDLCTKA